ncbi:MAG: hypothetical protein AAB354_02360 [candidate division KSB1 bacterium]
MAENDFYIDEREMTLEEVRDVLASYERKYGMTSQEFSEKWKRGETYLVAESVDWIGLYQAFSALHQNGENPSSAPRKASPTTTEKSTMTETTLHLDEHDMTSEEVKDILVQFERKYGMTSKQFAEKWQRGETHSVAESVPWITLFKSYRAMNGYDNNQGLIK